MEKILNKDISGSSQRNLLKTLEEMGVWISFQEEKDLAHWLAKELQTAFEIGYEEGENSKST